MFLELSGSIGNKGSYRTVSKAYNHNRGDGLLPVGMRVITVACVGMARWWVAPGGLCGRAGLGACVDGAGGRSRAVLWRGAEDGSPLAAPRRSAGNWKSHDSLSRGPLESCAGAHCAPPARVVAVPESRRVQASGPTASTHHSLLGVRGGGESSRQTAYPPRIGATAVVVCSHGDRLMFAAKFQSRARTQDGFVGGQCSGRNRRMKEKRSVSLRTG